MNRDILVKLHEQVGAALAAATPDAYETLARNLSEALRQLGQSAPPGPAPGTELGSALQALEDAWFKGTAPPAPPASSGHQARLSRLINDVLAVQRFALSLSQGDLSQSLPAKGLTAGGLKALQANLRHLTWQTQMIAQGDFSQRVDFMGEFSESFNSMVRNLAASHAQLQRRGEELARANADLTAANEDLEAFSYSVSHDLRAPLRAILGFAGILVEEHSGRLDAEGLRLLNIISGNTQLLTQLIDDLLTFARLGRQQVRKSVIDMTGLTQKIFQELTAAAPERDIRLVLKDLPPDYGDYALIKQVLVNLLANACKFTGPREIAEIEVGGWREADETIYYVKDNGVGFDMAFADKLFVVFQRLHRKSEFEGTGVGLAVVHKIVQRHGGRVWAEGKVDRGATFYFSLPSLKVD